MDLKEIKRMYFSRLKEKYDTEILNNCICYHLVQEAGKNSDNRILELLPETPPCPDPSCSYEDIVLSYAYNVLEESGKNHIKKEDIFLS